MHSKEIADVLDVVTKKAEALREAGVTCLVLGDLRIDLRPHLPPPQLEEDGEPDEAEFLGLPRGSAVPGYRIGRMEGSDDIDDLR